MKVKLLVSGVLLVIAALAISSVNAQDISEKSQEAITVNSSVSDQAVDLKCGSEGCSKEEKAKCTKDKGSCSKEKSCDKAKSCDKEKKSCDGAKKSCGGAK